MATKTDHKIVLTAQDKTRSALRAFNMSLKKVSGAVFSLKSGLTAAFGAAGLGFAIQQSIKATDSLAKTANRIGTTTEALGKLRFAADITGVSTQTLDMAMQRFTRRTSEAAQGTGEAVGALRELGIDAKELSALPLDQRMLVLSDAFAEVSDKSDQLRLAFKLFDSEGTAVLNTLRLGREEMAALFQEADRLGLVMSTDAAAGVEAASDAFLRLQRLFIGVRDQIVGALAPALDMLATVIKQELLESFESLGGSVKAFGREAANFILRAVKEIIEGMATFVRTIQAIINKFEELLNFFEGLAGLSRTTKTDFEGLASSFDRAADFVESLAFATRDFNIALGETKPPAQESVTLLERLSTAMNQLKGDGDVVQKAFNDGVKKAFDGTTDALTDMIMGTKSAADAFRDMANSIVRDLLRMAIQRQITEPLFQGISSFISPSVGARAMGGPVTRNKPYVVGERGPELFVPQGSGSVVPNNEMSGGSVTINQTIQISTGVAQTVRAEISNLLPQITNATKAAVVDAKRRGGSFAGAFGG